MRVSTLKKIFSPNKIPYCIINRHTNTKMLQSSEKEHPELSIEKEDMSLPSSPDNAKLKKDWSSVKDICQESKTFGSRLLENKEDVWHHNAW